MKLTPVLHCVANVAGLDDMFDYLFKAESVYVRQTMKTFRV